MLINANVSAFRPLLDIQHVEWFLLAATFRGTGRVEDLAHVIETLTSRLFPRRLGRSSLPFVDGGNSLANVFEQASAVTPNPANGGHLKTGQ